MNTADKLMNIAIDGDPGEEVVVDRVAQPDDEDTEEVVEETTVTRRVSRNPPKPKDKVIVIED